MKETMKIRFTKILHVFIVIVAILAISAIGFISCGEKSSLSQIVISPDSPGIAIGTTRQLYAYGALSNGVTFLETYLSWTSSNSDMATVDSTGLVTAGTTTGTITITATETDSHTYVSGSTTVTIDTISAVAVTPINPSMAISTTYQFSATATLTELSNWATQDVTSYMTWTSLDEAIATVDSTGIVSAVSAGTTTIQATDGYYGSSGTTLLTVTDTALSSMAVTAAGDVTSIAVAQTLQLTATGTDSDGNAVGTGDMTSHVTWSSPDTNVATIDAAGLVTGVGAGTVTITATDPITSISASIDITVN